jgi:hypothetical protein
MGELEEVVGLKDDGKGRYAVLGWYMIRDAWEELEPEAVDLPLQVQNEAGAKAKAHAKAKVRNQAQSEDINTTTIETQGEAQGEVQGLTQADIESQMEIQVENVGDANANEESEHLTRLFVRWKFAFEWIEAQGEPWWIKDLNSSDNDMAVSESNGTAVEVLLKMDEDVKDTVNPKSNAHSDIDNTALNPEPAKAAPVELDASSDAAVNANTITFSQDAPPLPECGEAIPFDSHLASPVTSNSSQHLEPAVPTNFKLGRQCNSCGVFSPRTYFEGWFCTNSSCQYHSMVSSTETTHYFSTAWLDETWDGRLID